MNSSQLNIQIDLNSSTFKSKSNHFINFDSDKWKLKNNITINLELVKGHMDPGLFDSYKTVLRYLSENNAASTVRSYDSAVLRYLRVQKVSDFSLVNVTNYRSNKANDEWLSKLRPVLLRWHKLREKGVSDELIDTLKSWKVAQNKSGVAVLVNDPSKGPLTDTERESFINSSAHALENNVINISDFAIGLIFCSLGVRPEQVSQLKVRDVCTKGGHMNPHSIRIPLAKTGSGFRAGFMEFGIVEEIHKILSLHIENLEVKVCEEFNFKVDKDVFMEIPLFQSSLFWSIGSLNDLEESNATDSYHRVAETISTVPNKIAKKLSLINRNNESLILNSRRFRYTFATNLVREGYDIVKVAKLLTHNDISNVHCYYKNSLEFVAYIRKQLSGSFSEISAAFLGKVVDSHEDAKNGGNHDMQIAENNGHIGVCGTEGRCDSQPLACYSCGNFQPLKDANHKGLLEDLLDERQRIVNHTKDEMIIEAQDHTIKAVARVIQICQNNTQGA